MNTKRAAAAIALSLLSASCATASPAYVGERDPDTGECQVLMFVGSIPMFLPTEDSDCAPSDEDGEEDEGEGDGSTSRLGW
jgi:hypothetical protein